MYINYQDIRQFLYKNLVVFTAVALLASVFAYNAIKTGSQDVSVLDAKIAEAASVDYFLKIEGVEGESSDDKHKNEIEILSWSWGVSNAATNVGGGGGAGKASFQDINFSSSVSKASPKLMLSTATGQHFTKATLTGRKSGQSQDFYKVTLSDVLITSYQVGGSSGQVPTDQFSLNFAKIEFEYRPTKPNGSLDTPVKAGYDVKQNKPI